jgi:hypothetical protein
VSEEPSDGDDWTEKLACLFAEQPAWIKAARHLRDDATSTVYFSHREGDPWRLEMRGGRARLVHGAAHDPDLAFRFSPRSIERLESVEGGIGEFAVALFEEIVDGSVDLRIRAGFARLAMRGYVKLLVAAGPPVLAFGASHGIRTLGALRKFVSELRSRGDADWEV